MYLFLSTFPLYTALCLCCHQGQVAGRRWPFSMDFHWFLVAILAPLGGAVQQSPDTVIQVGDPVILNCSGTLSGVSYLYWYKLPTGKDASLQLVVYSVEGGKADIEKEFLNHIQSNGTKNKRLSMKIDHALLNDSGTYFCAEQDSNYGNMIFGDGTKLTVIEKNKEIIPPSVAIFSPSKQEIQQKNKATLVCLASGFYPDHLTLVWMVNDVKRTKGVGTDEFSTQNGSTYSLTSRLRIPAWEWFNPFNHFECVANFFQNGKEESIHKVISGDAGCAVTEDSYLRYGNSVKLTYLILCGKALIYAVLVSSLLWRTKVGGKLYKE
ncbi:M1-specific T cell receptor beta chain-like [Pseudopipra pipra]|uniref:M1-specific T cell receptor beta chain-like n=1 Tax=Pseudopipra pipra TaxID=415032 RepID=UPI0031391D91